MNSTLQTVALGTAALGALSGTLGTFAVLRRQSLLGDAVSHAALPGVALAFVVTGSKAPLTLAVGAAIAGWLGTAAVLLIVRRSRVPYDSALGIVLSVFFGFGIVLLTALQKKPDASQAGLERYLFGQAATLLDSDVRALAGLGAVALAIVLLLWKEFKLLAFDSDYAATLGYPTRPLDFLLTGLLVLAVVLGLQCVGVVLMSALVVAPATAARQWSDRLGVVVVLAATFGGLSGLGGTLAGDALSARGKPVPTGPAIVLVATAIVGVSLMWKLLPQRRKEELATDEHG